MTETNPSTCATNVRIQEVLTRKDLKTFVAFPNKLYKNNPYYVPQLIGTEMDTLSKNKNHAFEFCESRYWLAYDASGHVVGRIAGIINHAYNKKINTFCVRFGWLDFIDDAHVVDALFHTVETWATSLGATCLSGPLGFLEFDVAGVLVEGFDEIPTAYGKYNAPYYQGHLERLGFGKEVDWVEYNIDVPKELPEGMVLLADKVAARYGLRVVQYKKLRDILKHADGVFSLMNRCYAAIHGYSELSEGQIEDLKKQFLPLLNLRFVSLILDAEDHVVAFGITLPSLSRALQKAKGYMYPFGFIHILRALKKNDTLDALLIAIDEQYKRKGVNALIFKSLSDSVKGTSITSLESTRELEHNYNVQNLWHKFSYRQHKRARCYMKQLV